jgi:uncharacterized membrane protein
MRNSKNSWTDKRVELIIGNILRTSVLISAGVTLTGGILYLILYGQSAPSYHVFRGEPAYLRDLYGIVRDLIALRSRGIIQFGLLLLIATPVARVAFSIIAFVVQRDRTYVIVTCIVLAALIYSLSGGYM